MILFLIGAAHQAFEASEREREILNAELENKVANATADRAGANETRWLKAQPRATAEAQLGQTKMEAVGQLTRGIAHDLNTCWRSLSAASI